MIETPQDVKRFIDSIFGVKPRARHAGDGAKRAAVRLQQHRDRQAARVAPALPALAEKRKHIATVRANRWGVKENAMPPRPWQPPRHIRAMERERAA